MQLVPHLNVKFMAELPRAEPAVMDSTAAKLLKTCPRLYFLRIVLGYRAPGSPIYFAFGGAYHKFRQILTESSGDLVLALNAAGDFWSKRTKLTGEPPVGSKYEFLTGQRLLASCNKANEAWKKEREQGRIIVLQSEQAFSVTLKDGITMIGGRADEIVRWGGKVWGRDFKTSSKMGAFYERTLSPNDQFARYTLAETYLCGEQVQGQLVEVLYNTKKEGPKLQTFTATMTQAQVAEFEDDQIYNTTILNKYREDDKWPKHEIHCPFCEFRLICNAPNEASATAQLKAGFEHAPWDFTKVDQEGEVGE